MIGIIIGGAAVVIAVSLYCCIRVIRNMQRISQRTALTVIFGIAGRMDVPKKNAIIGFCRRNLLKRKRRLGAVRDALMEDILLASGTACRRFCWK